jgi:hypothetical protein
MFAARACPSIDAMIPIDILALMLAATPVTSEPICATASHERLIVRADRDVCAPTVNRAGRPMAMGFLPTRCRDEDHSYRIDAAGPRDRCIAPK